MLPQEAASELDLRDYLRILRRRRWTIAVMALIVLSTSLAASLLQTPVYRATAKLLLQPKSTESLFDPNTGQRSQPAGAVATDIEVLTTQNVVKAVNDKLGSAPKISVKQVGQTDVIQLNARSTDPKRAAIVANTYANTYVEVRRKQAVDDLLAAGKEIQGKVSNLQREIDSLGSPPSSGSNGAVVDPQAARRSTLFEQQALFKQKLDEVQVDAALKTGGAQLVTSAAVPSVPVEPMPVRTAGVALFVGLMFGVATALMVDYLDDSIKSKEEVGRVAPELPMLGLIPVVPNWRDPKRPVVASLADSKSSVAEAYRSLRTSIHFMRLDRPLHTLQITSPAAGEGKTTTLANLGVALAQAGERVIMVDCDLRRPRIHHFYGVSNDIGFTSVLLGDVPLSSALQTVAGQDHLRVLASGPIPPNPAELLAGSRVVDVFTALQAEADIVLVDCPPVLPVTDAAVLSSRVDGVLLVVNAGDTTRRQLGRAHELLRQLGAPMIGIVLNGLTGEGAADYSYGYRYRYAYAQTDSANTNGRKLIPRRRKKVDTVA